MRQKLAIQGNIYQGGSFHAVLRLEFTRWRFAALLNLSDRGVSGEGGKPELAVGAQGDCGEMGGSSSPARRYQTEKTLRISPRSSLMTSFQPSSKSSISP